MLLKSWRSLGLRIDLLIQQNKVVQGLSVEWWIQEHYLNWWKAEYEEIDFWDDSTPHSADPSPVNLVKTITTKPKQLSASGNDFKSKQQMKSHQCKSLWKFGRKNSIRVCDTRTKTVVFSLPLPSSARYKLHSKPWQPRTKGSLSHRSQPDGFLPGKNSTAAFLMLLSAAG